MITWIKNNRLLSIVLLVCIGFFVYYIFNALRWIPYPNSIDYGEGFVMNYVKLWANSTWSWDINTPPYLTMVYGVGFSTLLYPFVKLFGHDLIVGRAVSFVTALIACYLVYLIVTRLTGKKVYGVIAGLLPATQPVFQDWSAMARVDMAAVTFSLLGFYVALRFIKTKYLYLAIIPFLCAVMIKVTAIGGLGAVVIYLLIYERKRVLPFIGLFIVGFVAMITPLMVASGGEYWKHLILYQNTIQNISFPQFLALFPGWFYPFIAPLVLALIYIKRCIRKKEYTLPMLFFVLALAVDMVTTFRPGASALYYMEAIFAGSICAVLGLSYVMVYIRRTKIKLNVVSVALGLVALATIVMPLRYTTFPDRQFTNSVEVAQWVMSDSEKPVITEIPSMALNMGKDIYIEYFIFANMARLGYWDETPYVDKYKEQYFDYVLLITPLKDRIKSEESGIPDGHFTHEALQAIDENYSLCFVQLSSYWQYNMFLYEANNKLINDEREIVRDFKNLDSYPTWDNGKWVWREK
jgi:4-amino-4-deoxy-L-arabinose transferase-like glycosyltransferase